MRLREETFFACGFLLSTGGQQTNIQAMHGIETQRRDSWPWPLVLYELGKSLALSAHECPLRSIRELKEMTSKAFYAVKLFSLPPSACFQLSLPPSARRSTQLHPLKWWLSFINWQFVLCLPLCDVNSRPRAQEVTCSIPVSGIIRANQ